MWRSVLVSTTVAVVLSTVVSAQFIQLPAAIYSNAAGEWSVEVLSACRSPTYGTVKFQNTTARIVWEDDAPDTLISGQFTDEPLSLAALADFMTKESREYTYRTCEHRENYLATPQRPTGVAHLTSTYLTMYTGILSSEEGAIDCAAVADRNVVIQALGSPLKSDNKGQWRLDEALHVIEIVVETKNLEGTCAQLRSAEAAASTTDTTLEGRKRSRKHRTGRDLNSASVVSQADEVLTENGVVTVRLIRRNAAMAPWMVRYYTPIMFAAIVIAYRVVHSFVSTKAAKTPL